MESDRAQAKAGAIAIEGTDPEFASAQAEARKFRLEEIKEENSHTRAMHAASIGVVGKLVGDASGAPNSIALIIAAFALMIAVGCYVAAGMHPEQAPLWTGHAEKAIATAVTMAAYLFGKITNSK